MSDLSVPLQTPNGHRYNQPTGLFINNQFVKSSTGQKITSISPSTETEIVSVYAASEQDVDTAVRAARKALNDRSWKMMSGTERGQLMAKLADLVESKKELLASTEAWDNGKPYTVALEEDLPETFNTLRYYSGWADKLHGQVISGIPGKFAYTIRQPIGVVAQIIPWNYPLSMAAWKLGPALACGNTVVLKPAEQTPVSILLLAELIKEAGFPPGVVNIVNGLGRDAGSALVQHPDVDKVAFTGSTATAREIMKMAAGTLKNVTLETGGKSPLIVFNDADLSEAVKWSHIGIMHNQGQICTSTSRVLVQDDIYDKFVSAFVKHTKDTSIVGDPFNKDTFQGPQVTKAQYDKILSYVKIGQSEGATVATGGAAHRGKGGKGYYIQPTIFTNVKDSMKVYREEIFGPVVVVTKFSDEDDAIRRANDTTYGLGAAVFTRDIEKAHRVAAEIQAGMVWVNSSQDSDYRVPFGGVKQSGIGRELGEAGLKEYSQVKAIHVNMTSRDCKL